MRRGAVVVLGAAAAPACVLACSLALSFDGVDDGVRDATQNDGSSGDAAGGEQPPEGGANDSSDATVDSAPPVGDAGESSEGGDDASADSGADAADGESPLDAADAAEGEAPEGGCPANTLGPTMVPAGGFCIDSTEVTVAQYEAFLAAKAGDTSGQPARCAWNTSYVPNFWPTSGPTSQALRGVDWCDATMFCAWAGKRLCGNPGGGPANFGNLSDPSGSQWFSACSRANDGLHVYPYGLAYDPTLCNGADYDAGRPLPAVPTCQGGYPGLFDMSGNIIEWEDSCLPTAPDASDPTGQSDQCSIRGGSFTTNAQGLRCDLVLSTARGNGGHDNGFRCCSK